MGLLKTFFRIFKTFFEVLYGISAVGFAILMLVVLFIPIFYISMFIYANTLFVLDFFGLSDNERAKQIYLILIIFLWYFGIIVGSINEMREGD